MASRETLENSCTPPGIVPTLVLADRDSSPWDRLSALPVLVESYEVKRLSAQLSDMVERVTTRIRLLGGGVDGLGEDVSPHDGEDDTLHVAGPVLEDAHDLPEVAELLELEAHRISYDAPMYSAQDIDAMALTPRAVNIKPCRVGDLRSLFDVYAACEARGLVAYGGGMAELDVGRGQIQLLASLFHPDGPNDVAPSGFNEDPPAADLPPSPLPAAPAPTGFRRVTDRTR